MKEKKMAIAVVAALVIIFALRIWFTVAHGCGSIKCDNQLATQNLITLRSGVLEKMGTLVRITVVAKNKKIAQESILAASDEIDRLQNIFDWRIEDSELSRINNEAYSKEISVSDEMFEVLSFSLKVSAKSEGLFDITVGPIIDLWKEAAQSGVKPTQMQIQAAKEKTGYKKVVLDDKNKTIKLLRDGMRLDLGAVAKGYAIDRAIEAIKQSGAVGALVDIGGDMRCFGKAPEEKKKWVIGLQDPRNMDAQSQEGNILMRLDLSDRAIATSGDYRRYLVIDGEHYSHIVNPKAGSSAYGLSSVSVISESAMESDALATAVTVMGFKKGLELIESIGAVECILISDKPEFKIVKSSGLDRLVLKK